MKSKFVCNQCGSPCYLVVQDLPNVRPAFMCPVFNSCNRAAWKRYDWKEGLIGLVKKDWGFLIFTTIIGIIWLVMR